LKVPKAKQDKILFFSMVVDRFFEIFPFRDEKAILI